MTDIEFTLKETNRERAITGRSARYKKGKRGGHSCSLSTDKMTKKEIKKMSGPCKRWILSEIYTWEEFKKMPDYVQVEYINHYIDKFGVGLPTLSMYLFEQTKGVLDTYLRKHGLIKQIHIHNNQGHPGTKTKNIEELKNYVARTQNPEEDKETKCAEHAETSVNDAIWSPEMQNQILQKEKKEKTVTELHTTFSTEYISDKIDLEALRTLQGLFYGRTLKVTITVETL